MEVFLLMSVVLSLQSGHDIVVFVGAFLSYDLVSLVFQVNQVLSCLYGLKSVSNHDDGQVLVVFLDLVDSCLDLLLTLRI